MIDRTIKRSLGQMMKGVQVVGAARGDDRNLYCSHWVCQVSFEEPIVMASVSFERLRDVRLSKARPLTGCAPSQK